MRNFISYLVIIVSLGGCSTNLSVQVDIFDPKGVSANDTLEATAQREVAKHAFALKKDLYGQARTNLESQLKKYLEDLRKNAIVSDEDVSRFADNAINIIYQKIGNAMQNRNQGMETIRLAETITEGSARQSKFEAGLQAFQSATQVLVELRANVKRPFEGPIRGFISSLDPQRGPDLQKINNIVNINSDLDRAIEENLKSLTGGFDLFDDHLAPAIISAPNNYWKGVYNKTKASGQIGNTDIAIKMETVGTFTIKGLRLDASKVTEATFEVLKQSVRMVAAAYGVPIPSGAPSSNNTSTSPASPTDLLLTVDQMHKAADRKRQLSRNAALTLLDIIISERADLTSSTAATREAAVIRLQQSYEAYKSQLQGE